MEGDAKTTVTSFVLYVSNVFEARNFDNLSYRFQCFLLEEQTTISFRNARPPKRSHTARATGGLVAADGQKSSEARAHRLAVRFFLISWAASLSCAFAKYDIYSHSFALRPLKITKSDAKH